MCGISGYFRISGSESQYFLKYFREVNRKIVQRGPDCFGIWGTDLNMYVEKKMKLDWVNDWEAAFNEYFNHPVSPRLVMVNFRGIPTTEFLRPAARADQTIQPYHDDHHKVIVTHNGQLSNDIEMTKDIPNIMVGEDHDIDTYAFVKLLKGGDTDDFAKVLRDIDGSFAIVAFNRENRKLYFARNFRGLYFSYWRREGSTYLVWSSEEGSLTDTKNREDCVLAEMPPYSAQILSCTSYFNFSSFMNSFNSLDNLSKYKTDANKNSAVVVFSGGLDSTVCATMACEQFKTVHLLHFKYGARAEGPEIKSVTAISEFLKKKFPNCSITLSLIDLDFIKKLGGSTLTDHSLSIASGELGVETDHEWVPARNIAMIGLTTSYCDRHDIGNIILGLNMEEGSVFSDNSVEFYKAMEKALNLGSHSRPKLLMPVGNMMKHHIVKKGLEIGAPFDLSWSCYEGGEERCGDCGPCTMRRRAYAMNGVRDPVKYLRLDPESEKILQYYGVKT